MISGGFSNAARRTGVQNQKKMEIAGGAGGAYSPKSCKDYKHYQSDKGERDMKATGIVRRIDDLGRVVIPKEIRRTLRIREGDPLRTALTQWERFCFAMDDLAKRNGWS